MDSLPDEIIHWIFKMLHRIDICNILRTCRRFHDLVDESFWKSLLERDFDEIERKYKSWRESYRSKFGILYTIATGSFSNRPKKCGDRRRICKVVSDLRDMIILSDGGMEILPKTSPQNIVSFDGLPRLLSPMNRYKIRISETESKPVVKDVVSIGSKGLYFIKDRRVYYQEENTIHEEKPEADFIGFCSMLNQFYLIRKGILVSYPVEADRVDFDKPIEEEALRDITHISCSHSHGAVISNKQLYTFGLGAFGVLGHGDTEDRSKPTLVKGLKDVSMVACGYSHTAVIAGNSLYIFGDTKGIVDRGYTLKPTFICHVENVINLSCGLGFTAFVSFTSGVGKLYTFGRGGHGELGHGSLTRIEKPKQVEGFNNVVQVSCGINYTNILCKD